MTGLHSINTNESGRTAKNWMSMYKFGVIGAIVVVIIGMTELAISILAKDNTAPKTIIDWFSFFKENPFVGLRDMGLLNIFMNFFGLPLVISVIGAHRNINPSFAVFGFVMNIIGVAIYLSTNKAFAMMDLSKQYIHATTSIQRLNLEYIGQTIIFAGKGHTACTFLGFFFNEVSLIFISFVMLHGGIFNRINAFMGIAGFSILAFSECIITFFPSWNPTGPFSMLLSASGGIFAMVWYILSAKKLFCLSRQ